MNIDHKVAELDKDQEIVEPQLNCLLTTDNEDFFQDTKIYLYKGGGESETMIEHVKKFKSNMLKNEFVSDILKIKLSINLQGKHNDSYWSDEFPKAIEWLFFSNK
ncbi:MAG: hypothetical protein RLZZ312_296 [Bacteroidota bacterium]|jgi:hypothetical protein